MKNTFFLSILTLLFLAGCKPSDTSDSNFAINVSFSDSASGETKDGRLLLMLSNNDEKEPRFQINDGLKGQIVFGMNVDDLGADQKNYFR